MTETLIIPTNHREFIIVYVGDETYSPTVHEVDDAHRWFLAHQKDWPNNFQQLQAELGMEFALRMEILPARDPKNEYVFIFESEWGMVERDVKSLKKLFRPRRLEQQTVFIAADYFTKIQRVSKDLLPFL